MEATLVLQNRKSKSGVEPVVIYYSKDGKDLRIPTGIKIAPRDWSAQKGRVLKREGNNAEEINRTLGEKKDEVNRAIRDYMAAHQCKPSVDQLKGLCKLGKKVAEKPKGFFDYYHQFLLLRRKDPNMAKGTHKDFVSLLKALEAFE